MADLFWLTEAQVARISPFFPLSHGVPRVDGQRVVSGIIHWSRMGVFNRIFAGLAGHRGQPDRPMIDATHLKTHRTAASLLRKTLYLDVSAGRKAA